MSWSLNKTKSLENFLTVFRKHSITLQKNTLRNFPSTITLDSFSTLDELKSQWPTSSLDTPPNW
jgi:hypothetical protein